MAVLITFKSQASGDVLMLEKSGKEMLRLLNKDANDSKGILTVEQLPGAIGILKSAIAADMTQLEKGPVEGEVHLYQRAVPVLELLERSLKESTPVTWGV